MSVTYSIDPRHSRLMAHHLLRQLGASLFKSLVLAARVKDFDWPEYYRYAQAWGLGPTAVQALWARYHPTTLH